MRKVLMVSLLVSLCAGTQLAHASNRWACDASDGLSQGRIEMDLSAPDVSLLTYLPGDQGNLRVKRTQLISDTTVSSWKMDRNGCEITSGWLNDSKQEYQFEFVCFGYRRGGANNETQGSLTFHADTASGTYEEHLSSLIPPTSIELRNCKAE